jgi:MFS family permease
MAIRLISGFCFAGLFTTVDSWLNSGVSNQDRGRVLSIYRIIDILAVTGSQYLIPVFGTDGFTIFAIMAMMVSLSMVPVAIADRSNPEPPDSFRLDLGSLWRLSPLACIGCFAIGLTNSAFRVVGPIYAEASGFSVADVATFMSAGILGGAVLQYPLGRLSDRGDRRLVLLAATTGAVAAALGITLVAGNDPHLNFVGIFLFGAFSLPLYSLAAAHANDHAGRGQFVQISAGLLAFFSAGAMIGPAMAAFLVQFGGPSQLFNYISAIHGLLVLVTLYRIARRGAAPVAGRRGFAMLLRTSTAFHWLAGRATDTGKDPEHAREKQPRD